MKWGRLINTALDCGLDGEDALWAVLVAAERFKRDGLEPLLTGPELEALAARGRHGSFADAAADLGKAPSTVHRYLQQSARKLGVPVRDAVAEAERRGLLKDAA